MFESRGAAFVGNPSAVQYFASSDRRQMAVSVFARLSGGAYGHRSFLMRNGSFEPQQPGDAWQSLGGVFVSDPVAITSRADSAIRVFGRGQDNGLWVIWTNGTSWFGPERVGGEFTSSIAAVDSEQTGMHVFVRGRDNAVWHYYYHGGSRGVADMSHHSLEGATLGGPTAVATREGRIHVFVRGLNNNLWRKNWTGSAWTEWQPLYGPLHPESNPVAGVVLVPPSLESQVFVFFHDPQGRLRYIAFSPSNPPNTFYRAGDSELSEPVEIGFLPAVASHQAGSLNVFATRNTGGALIQSHAGIGGPGFNGLQSWTEVGGRILSNPAATSLNGRVSVFVRGLNGGLFQRWWDGSRWWPA